MADTEAQIVVFYGSAHAFLTSEHEALSATHLMQGLTGDETSEEKLRTVKVKDLTEGDVLVFLRGAERHAIRELADANLPQGMRKKLQGYGRSRLRHMSAENGLSLAELKSQLEQAGCKRHVVNTENVAGKRSQSLVPRGICEW